MKISEFNCVEMKHRGAKKVLEQIAEMTRAQELEFWRIKTQNLVAHKFDTGSRGIPFTTYENRNNPHIAIHHSTCKQLRKRGGTGRGKYKEYETYQLARNYAETTNLPVQDCSFCKPQFSKIELANVEAA